MDQTRLLIELTARQTFIPNFISKCKKNQIIYTLPSFGGWASLAPLVCACVSPTCRLTASTTRPAVRLASTTWLTSSDFLQNKTKQKTPIFINKSTKRPRRIPDDRWASYSQLRHHVLFLVEGVLLRLADRLRVTSIKWLEIQRWPSRVGHPLACGGNNTRFQQFHPNVGHTLPLYGFYFNYKEYYPHFWEEFFLFTFSKGRRAAYRRR